MGWLGAIGSMFSWLGGSSVLATVARLAIGIGISKLINRSNESSQSSTTSTPQGTRQQIPAATDNLIPVAYGDSYFSGTITDTYSINSNKELFGVITLCEVTGDIFSTNPNSPNDRLSSDITIDEIYINNQLVTFKADGTTVSYTTDDTGVRDTNLENLVGIYLYKGNSNYPMLPCVKGTTTPIAGTLPPAAYEIIPDWDNTYLNQNTVFAIVKLNYDPSKGAHTIPTIKFHVRNSMNKPGDVIHDYMTNQLYGMKMSESMVDNDSIAALNTFSDENVTLGSYPAQPRYRINGLVRTTETVFNNVEKLAAAAGSVISYDIARGKWSVVINKATSMTRTFNDSNIIGAVKPSVTSLDNFYNAVEVQFPYKVLKDQYNYVRFDLPEVYQNANEQKNTMQITHEFVNDVVQATILANLDLRQSRENLSVTFKTDFSQYGVAIGEVIGVTSDVYGWTDKLFKVLKVRRVETDEGELTVEITAQAYNPDVYTVEDITDFVPMIGAGHSLPSITPIDTPAAPLVNSTTLSSQPAIYISGIVPTGIVTEMEFWYTADENADDNLRPYTLLGTMRNENGGPFDTGFVSTFKTVLLASGNYRFKVRAANNAAMSTSKFSPPSSVLAYTYVQAPDVLKYSTPTVDDETGELDSNGMTMGLMAAYMGYKLFEKPIDDYFKELFGITDEQAEKANTSVEKDNAASTDSKAAIGLAEAAEAEAASAKSTAEDASNKADVANQNALEASAKADLALQTALSNGSADPVITESTLVGKVFPCLFGVGDTVNSSTVAGIFTHDHLVFAGSAVSPLLHPNNIVSTATTVSTELTGDIQNFYSIPNSNTFTKPPVYDQTKTDKFEYDSRLSLYYATATYAGGNLDEQSWSNWNLLSSNNGVTGSNVGTAIVSVGYSNPWVDDDKDYVVDEIYEEDGIGNVVLSTGNAASYDPFLPNVEITTTTYTNVDTRKKELTIKVKGSKQHGGGANELIIFGTSVYNQPNGIPFAGSTAFGHVSAVYRQTYPNANAFKAVANNGSTFVAISPGSDNVYWSSDGAIWNRVFIPGHVTTLAEWLNKHPTFLVPYLPGLVKHSDEVKAAIKAYNDALEAKAEAEENYIKVKADPESTSDEISGAYDGTASAYTNVEAKRKALLGVQKEAINPPIVMPDFEFLIHDGSKFLVYDFYNGVATSTDGKQWTEVTTSSNLSKKTVKVVGAPGKYLAVGAEGVQYSSDGLTWGAPVYDPEEFANYTPVTCAWDGSKFIIGSTYLNGRGSAFFSTVDGVTLTKMTSLNNPYLAQSLTDEQNVKMQKDVLLVSGLTSALP